MDYTPLDTFLLLRDASIGLDRLTKETARTVGFQPVAVDLLLRLNANPGGRARMTRLAEQLGFTTGGITRIADRLEIAGLVTRQPADDDNRGINLALSPDGNEVVEKALAHVLDSHDPDWVLRLADRVWVVRDHLQRERQVAA